MDKGFEAAVYQKAVDGKALNVALCKSTMSNVKIETIFEVYREYEKYQERFDKKKMQREWRVIEPCKVVGNTLNIQCYTRQKIGPMCYDREMIFEHQIVKESATRYVQYIWTLERADVPPNPECFQMEFFHMKIYE